ncbi:MAG: VWA domain-containing protein [Pyrinomonadaceae bacterium]|nr:VWA domain-containing protein [Pyrinomonadaceae bacterium]
MKQFVKGQKSKLSEITTATNLSIGVNLAATSGLTFDISCFGVDANDKLSDDRYFIFYNQKNSPCNSIIASGAQSGDGETFQVNLDKLPSTIRKLVFTATTDGAGAMSNITKGHLRITAQNAEAARFDFTGADFKDEKAIIIGEIYFKDAWRFAVVGQGFNGGLSALLKHFGGEEKEEATAQVSTQTAAPVSTPPTQKKISLVKKIEKDAPQLVNLAKTLTISLEKRNLQETVAKVALVVDASGSMNHQYQNGDVQRVIDRIVPLAVHFDDDGELDTWFFASKQKKTVSVTLSNVQNYVNRLPGLKSWFSGILDLGISNDEPLVMKDIIREYQTSQIPAYVVFISDGGVHQNAEITRLISDASRLPIFWQFVGIGGSSYGILEQLDTMGGRFIDNCNFFALDDIKNISDAELYERLLNEFPAWLKLAKSNGIIR